MKEYEHVFPALLKHINIRISKQRYILKNLRTSESMLILKNELLLLSVCDGTNSVEELGYIYGQVMELANEQAKNEIEKLLDKYKKMLCFYDTPTKHFQLQNFHKQVFFRSKPWNYSKFREESPFELQVTLTERCNHACNYCFKSCDTSTEKELSFETVKDVIDQAAEMGVQEITFSGGEPTLYKGLIQLVSHAVEKGIYVKISTNATTLDKTYIEQLKAAGAEYIHLSLPAITEKAYDAITGTLDHLKKVKEAISLLKEAGFYIRVKMVLIPQNKTEIEPLLDYCMEHEVDFVHLAPFILTEFGRGGEALVPFEEELEYAAKIAQEKMQQTNEKMFIASPPLGAWNWKDCTEIVKCGGIKDSLLVLSNGNISFCEALGNESEFVLGNVKKEKVMDIWQSDLPERIFSLEQKEIDPVCKACEYLKDCHTGCFMFSKLFFQNSFAMDPRCFKNKEKKKEFQLDRMPIQLQYPVLKNTVRIKKLPSYCWITEAEYDVDEFITPATAFLLSLCNGEFQIVQMKYTIQEVFALTKNQADEFVDQMLHKYADCIVWERNAKLRQTRYQPKDFIYHMDTLLPKSSERCDTPCEMHLVLTHACNFRCIYCFNASDAKREDELTKSQWLDIVKQGHELGVVKCTLTGGEPFLNPAFFELLELLQTYDIVPYICTNASFVNDEIACRFKELGIENVQLSLDTANEKLFDLLTDTKGMLVRVQEGMRSLHKYGIKIFVKAVLTPLNVKGVPDLIRMCLDYHVTKLVLDRFDVSASGRGGNELLLSEEDIEWIRATAWSMREEIDGNMQVKAVAHTRQWKEETDIIPCGAFRKSFIVLPNGDISACEKLIDVGEMTAGNVKLKSLKEIWLDERTTRLVSPKVEQMDEDCRLCEHLQACWTGCYALKYYENRDLYAKDPRCFIHAHA